MYSQARYNRSLDFCRTTLLGDEILNSSIKSEPNVDQPEFTCRISADSLSVLEVFERVSVSAPDTFPSMLQFSIRALHDCREQQIDQLFDIFGFFGTCKMSGDSLSSIEQFETPFLYSMSGTVIFSSKVLSIMPLQA